MSAPFDLSSRPASTGPPRRPNKRSGGTDRGTGTFLDEYARTVFQIAGAISLFLLVYLFYGLWSGAWADPQFHTLTHADRLRNEQNIALVNQGLQISLFISVVSLLICTFRDEGIGYVLLLTAGFFSFGIPFITEQLNGFRQFHSSLATRKVYTDFSALSWLFTVPGVIWVLADFVRRFISAREIAAIQRANVKYGASTQMGDATNSKRFLGRCWEMSYCRDLIRPKCPIFLKRKGPCWWYKQGCMCDERIVLQAMITQGWKQQAARVDEMHNPDRLTPAAKRERCRNCIIYNEHERQKYKLLVTLTLVATPVFCILNAWWLQAIAKGVLNLLGRLYIGAPDPYMDMITGHGSPPPFIEWTLIGSIAVILMSQILRGIEVICFKLKI